MERFERTDLATDFIDLGSIVGIRSSDNGEWCRIYLKGGGDFQVNMPSTEVNRMREEHLAALDARGASGGAGCHALHGRCAMSDDTERPYGWAPISHEGQLKPAHSIMKEALASFKPPEIGATADPLVINVVGTPALSGQGPPGPSCGTCRFWEVDPDNSELGDCRRYPPVWRPYGTNDDGEFEGDTLCPTTHGDDWCGEYERSTTTQGDPSPAPDLTPAPG